MFGILYNFVDKVTKDSLAKKLDTNFKRNRCCNRMLLILGMLASVIVAAIFDSLNVGRKGLDWRPKPVVASYIVMAWIFFLVCYLFWAILAWRFRSRFLKKSKRDGVVKVVRGGAEFTKWFSKTKRYGIQGFSHLRKSIPH